MKILKTFDFNMLEALNENELSSISGGHDGVAYKIGYVVGETIKIVGEVATVAGMLFVNMFRSNEE